MYRNLLLMYLNLYWKTEGKIDNKTQKAKNMMNISTIFPTFPKNFILAEFVDSSVGGGAGRVHWGSASAVRLRPQCQRCRQGTQKYHICGQSNQVKNGTCWYIVLVSNQVNFQCKWQCRIIVNIFIFTGWFHLIDNSSQGRLQWDCPWPALQRGLCQHQR